MSDTIPHCKCGHNARPHTDTHCHQCDCTKLTLCDCRGLGIGDQMTCASGSLARKPGVTTYAYIRNPTPGIA